MKIQRYILIYILLLTIQQSYAELSDYEKNLLHNLSRYVDTPASVVQSLYDLPPCTHKEAIVSQGIEQNILFAHYPSLTDSLSYIRLGTFPTPLQQCSAVNAQFPHVDLWIKNDGKTGKTVNGTQQYGGNKLRKLQYLLADAIAHGHMSVLTFGAAGSNHALQTSVCAQQCGLNPICILDPQRIAYGVRKNLLMHIAHRTNIRYTKDLSIRGSFAGEICSEYKKNSGEFPYIIPIGGSCPRGAIGYVEAAFELKEQIDCSIMPVPDRIYITLGSAGSAAGLLLGLKAAGLRTKIYLVLESAEKVTGQTEQKMIDLFAQTNLLLQQYDATFPTCRLEESDYTIISDYASSSYGLIMQSARDAIDFLYDTEGICLDGTYTGNCFAALLRDLQSENMTNNTVLFWDTFCADDFSTLTDTVDYHDLPESMHYYFEKDVQELDRLLHA